MFGQYREAVARGLAARDLALLAQRRPQGLLRVSVPFVLGRRLIADGRLVELLPNTAAIGPRIVLLAAPGPISSPNIQAFLELAQRLFDAR